MLTTEACIGAELKFWAKVINYETESFPSSLYLLPTLILLLYLGPFCQLALSVFLHSILGNKGTLPQRVRDLLPMKNDILIPDSRSNKIGLLWCHSHIELRLIVFKVDWSWGWLKLRLIEVEVDTSWGWSSWGWLNLKLIDVEVDWSWGWLKLSFIEV